MGIAMLLANGREKNSEFIYILPDLFYQVFFCCCLPSRSQENTCPSVNFCGIRFIALTED